MKRNNTPKLNSDFRVLKLVSPVLLVGVYVIVQEIMLIL